MNIAVLNGSPKGAKSVTMQYVHYLQKKLPEHELKIHNVAQRIGRIERDRAVFDGIIDGVRSADAVLWAFPLYYCLVCSQYKRFIELVFERGVEDAFAGKQATALSTSIHFFDHTAHNYVHAVCEDLGMHYVDGYSADMQDLFKAEERERLLAFAADFVDAVEGGRPSARVFPPLPTSDFLYQPGAPTEPVDVGGKRVLVLTDAQDGDSNLTQMVGRLANAFAGEAEVVNLHDLKIKGGCLGCCKCALDNECVYRGTDDYLEFFDGKVKTADVLVLAGTVKDRYLSAEWKRFFDRSFYNGHAPSLRGKQVGFVISGPVSHLPDLRAILHGYIELQPANVVDLVSDDCEDSGLVDARLEALARRAVAFAERGFIRPPTFPAVAGQRLFRDEIWGRLRWIFQADYRKYRELGVFDFPHRDWKTRLLNAVLMPLSRVPRVRREFRKQIVDGMIRGFPKVIEKA